jgi:TetR/AcrR family transcriptional regulator, transcriptional repressor for nem operon
MGYSQAQKVQGHEKILGIAGRQIKGRGLESLAIDALMKKAGLTKGAFYCHFASRDELVLEAAREARKSGNAVLDSLVKDGVHPSFETVIDAYLNWQHVVNPGYGCAVCALAGEAKSAPEPIKAELTDNFENQVRFIAKSIGGQRAIEQARAVMSAFIGAVSIARTLSDEALAKSIINETRNLLLQSVETVTTDIHRGKRRTAKPSRGKTTKVPALP